MRRRVVTNAVAGAASWILPKTVLAETTAKEERQIRFTMKLSNPTDEPLLGQLAWMYLPMRRTSMQELVDVQASLPHELMTDELGQSVLALRIERMAPHAVAMVNVTARVLLQVEPAQEPLSAPSDWLGADRLVQIEDPALHVRALQLKRASATETARDIYDWVRSSMVYAGYVADEAGASEALRTLRGDCTEYAYLCVALARINGIPARVVGGCLAPRDFVMRARDAHDWAQMHLDGAWRTVDAQLQRWGDAKEYLAFHIRTQSVRSGLNPIGSKHRFRGTEPLRVGLI